MRSTLPTPTHKRGEERKRERESERERDREAHGNEREHKGFKKKTADTEESVPRLLPSFNTYALPEDTMSDVTPGERQLRGVGRKKGNRRKTHAHHHLSNSRKRG